MTQNISPRRTHPACPPYRPLQRIYRIAPVLSLQKHLVYPLNHVFPTLLQTVHFQPSLLTQTLQHQVLVDLVDPFDVPAEGLDKLLLLVVFVQPHQKIGDLRLVMVDAVLYQILFSEGLEPSSHDLIDEVTTVFLLFLLLAGLEPLNTC